MVCAMNTTPSAITKTEAKQLLGLPSDYALAKWFGIKPQSLVKWHPDEPIPELRNLQLRTRRPELFARKRATA
jgi:hypothetical protein